MKIFDLHIGVSDSVVVTGKDPFAKIPSQTVLPNQFDFRRAKLGNLEVFMGAMCCVVLKKGDLILPQNVKKEIDKHVKVYEDFEDQKILSIVRSKQDFEKKGLKTILGIEGIYFVDQDEDLKLLQELIERGVRVIGPVWNLKSKLFKGHKLTKIGKEVFALASNNNLILDLGHSEKNYLETIVENYAGPVFDSHTCYKKLVSHKRNITKDQIKLIIKRGGIIGLTFVGPFAGGNSLDNIYKQISQFLDDFGDNNLAIGSDFDGMSDTDIIVGLEDVSTYNNLVNYLSHKGISRKTIVKIFYQNAVDFFKKSLK